MMEAKTRDDGLFVGRLDTGGISSSGRTFVAIGRTEDEAREALWRAWRRSNRARHIPQAALAGGHIHNPRDLFEYYGIQMTGPLKIGTGEETE